MISTQKYLWLDTWYTCTDDQLHVLFQALPLHLIMTNIITTLQKYSLLKNNGEHVIMTGTIGTAISIQVDINMYQNLHKLVHNMIPELGYEQVKANWKQLAGTVISKAQDAADMAETGHSMAVANSFRVDYTEARSAINIGLVSGRERRVTLLIDYNELDLPVIIHCKYTSMDS